ncbi:MAG: hypothetical protein ACTH3G_01075 [Citricoccus sp.]|uniref:hypothetical protein n=1 Tax=Citricoccus nitrophenolicus TaxID=863575 RepID=UPI0039B46D1B
MPWFAWIAIIAILVWGGISLYGMASGKPLPWSEDTTDPQELEKLKKRIDALESGQAKPELERRIDRIEAKVEKREIRDNQHDAWERQAKELGLDQGDDQNTAGH